jgi:hypothetical protein
VSKELTNEQKLMIDVSYMEEEIKILRQLIDAKDKSIKYWMEKALAKECTIVKENNIPEEEF